MTKQLAVPLVDQDDPAPALTDTGYKAQRAFLPVRRSAPLIGALLIGLALAGCGGSESSLESATATDIGAKSTVATKAVEATDATVAIKAEGDGQVNSIDTVVGDMRDVNDFVLRGYEGHAYGWYVGPGSTHMGNNPTFRNSPHWSTFGNDSSYIGSSAKAMLPWLAVFDGPRHDTSNVAVEFRNMRTYVKSRSSGEWKLLGGPAKATGTNYGKPGTGLSPTGESMVRNSETSSTISMGQDSRYFWHGWWDAGVKGIDGWDIGAFFVTVQARLVVADESRGDERGRAELGLQVGADYYLETSTDYAGIAPNIGISRTKKLTSDWQAFNYTTLSDVGTQIPGGGIPESELRASPPPLQ
jgi:hypothetical protein